MRALVSVISFFLLGIWSVIAWGSYKLLAYAGETAAANADVIPGSPELIEWLSWAAGAGSHVGAWLIGIAWLLGTLLILMVAAVINRMMRRRSAMRPS